MASTLTTALRLRGFAALATTIGEAHGTGPASRQKVYSPAAPHAARAAATKPVMIASGRRRFTAAGAGTLRLKLTSCGPPGHPSRQVAEADDRHALHAGRRQPVVATSA